MASFSTVHIFGYGETQLIKENYNQKAPTVDLSAVPPVVANVYSKKPVDNTATSDYHAVNIFNNMFADFQPKTGEGFRVKWEDLDKGLIDALLAQFETYISTTTTTTTTVAP